MTNEQAEVYGTWCVVAGILIGTGFGAGVVGLIWWVS